MSEYYRRHLDDRQVHRRWMDPRIHAVRVANVQAYLVHHGWKQVPPDRPHVLVFQEPIEDKEGPLYQWIPDSEQRRDYTQCIYELIAAIAEIEDRYAGDVLTDILRQPADGVSTNGPGARAVEPAPR